MAGPIHLSASIQKCPRLPITIHGMDNNELVEADDRQVLESLLTGFEGNIDELALALGLKNEALESYLSGEEEVDSDLAMKIRGIAQERGIDIN